MLLSKEREASRNVVGELSSALQALRFQPNQPLNWADAWFWPDGARELPSLTVCTLLPSRIPGGVCMLGRWGGGKQNPIPPPSIHPSIHLSVDGNHPAAMVEKGCEHFNGSPVRRHHQQRTRLEASVNRARDKPTESTASRFFDAGRGGCPLHTDAWTRDYN